MKKTRVFSALAGVALLAAAGSAHAAGTMDINIYGASAEYNFWKQAGVEFLKAQVPAGLGCGTVSGFIPDAATGAANGIIVGTSCTNTTVLGSNDSVNFRVSNKASYDGIFAVTSSTDSQKSNGTCALNARPMANAAATDTLATLGCNVVTVGASDVPADAFTQHSSGLLHGPAGGGAILRSFSKIPTTGVAAIFQPVKVPFGFFVTNNISVRTCGTGPSTGDYCNADEDCGSYFTVPTDTTSPVLNYTCSAARPIAVSDNITREMAVQLLSNTLPSHNWSDFAGFSPLTAVTCVRHAGSGSHATMDLALMNKGTWGGSWPAAQSANFYFNDSTGDLLSCMNTQLTAGKGAIGYADADTDLTKSGAIPAGNLVGPLKYNGNYPNSQNIKSGVYDLYADQTLYLAPTAVVADAQGAKQSDAVALLMGYLNDTTGSHLNTPGYKFHNYWAASSEMQVGRGSSPLNPYAYPARGQQNPNPGQ